MQTKTTAGDLADGTERLCRALYGRRATARDYIGGSEAKMLHDAADRLAALRPASDEMARDGWRPIGTLHVEFGDSVILAVEPYGGGKWAVGEATWHEAEHAEDGGEWWWANEHGSHHADPIIVRLGRPVFYQPLPPPPVPASPETDTASEGRP